MTLRREIVAWTIAAMASTAGGLGWCGGSRESTVARTTTVRLVPAIPPTDAQILAAHASRTVSGDPFRLERRPASVAFGAAPASPTPPSSSGPRPPLVVSGIVGPPWRAVLEGMPGREGSTVVVEGESFGELRIRSIRGDTVVVAGRDTTWRLVVRRPW
jgi:hypothetical protein